MVVGGYVNALQVARALAATGIRVAVVTTELFDIAHRSRAVSEVVSLPSLNRDPSRLLDLLELRAKRWRGWAVYPTNDQALEALARGRERLGRSYVVIAPPWELSQRLLRKDRFHALVREVGVESARLHGRAEARVLDAAIAYPVVVKPVESHRFAAAFGAKLLVAHDRAELASCVARVERAGLEAEVLDLIPGGDEAHYSYTAYFDRRGEPVAGVGMRQLRLSPPFAGVARVAEVCDTAVAREPTLEVLRHVGWRGMASAHYKLDPRDGRLRLLEINGRPSLMHGLARRAGVDCPLLAWNDQVLGEPVAAGWNGWRGVWIHEHADLLHSIFSRRLESVSLGEYIRPYRRPRVYAVWSRRDPTPFLAQWGRTLAQAARLPFSARDRDELRARAEAAPRAGPRG